MEHIIGRSVILSDRVLRDSKISKVNPNMAGICGWLGSDVAPQAAPALLQRMVSRLTTATNETSQHHHTLNASLAAEGHPTLYGVHGDENCTVAYVGKVYWNRPELTRLATELGPAAAVAQAYQLHGPRFLQYLRGTFALAIVDTRQKTTLLAIDRMGIQTLSYVLDPQGIVFATTANSLAAHPSCPPLLDPQAIFNYLYFHVVPAPRGIYQGQRKLLPGQYALFRNGREELGFYWQLHYQDQDNIPLATLANEFRGLLYQAVARNTDEHTGAFLSGGTDSSTMAGILTEVQGRPAQTFSIGFDARGYDETEYARITVRHFGTEHHEYYVTPQDVTAALTRVAQAYDEPFGNASAVPTYYCAKLARDHGIATMIAGDGGDEIFAGNARYAKQQIFEHYRRLPLPLRSAFIEPWALHLPAVTLFSKLRSYVDQARIPLPDRLETYNFLHRNPITDILSTEFLADINSEEPLELLREVYVRTASNSTLNRMMHLDLKITLADNDLRKVGRMCELAGVEVRYPLLDQEVVEFSGRVPPALKLRGQQLRFFFKQALKDFLAPETLTKKKHGFGLPTGLWLKEHPPLRDLARESLEALTRRGYLNPGYGDRLWLQHSKGDVSYYGVMIWTLMMLELWLVHHGH